MKHEEKEQPQDEPVCNGLHSMHLYIICITRLICHFRYALGQCSVPVSFPPFPKHSAVGVKLS